MRHRIRLTAVWRVAVQTVPNRNDPGRITPMAGWLRPITRIHADRSDILLPSVVKQKRCRSILKGPVALPGASS